MTATHSCPQPQDAADHLELFARGQRANWVVWGNQADETYYPTWDTYLNHSRSTSPPG